MRVLRLRATLVSVGLVSIALASLFTWNASHSTSHKAHAASARVLVCRYYYGPFGQNGPITHYLDTAPGGQCKPNDPDHSRWTDGPMGYIATQQESGDGTVPLYEVAQSGLFGNYVPDDLYTTDPGEKDGLLKQTNPAWHASTFGYVLPAAATTPPGTTQIYRLYHPGTHDHVSAQQAERDTLSQQGWSIDNVSWYFWNSAS